MYWQHSRAIVMIHNYSTYILMIFFFADIDVTVAALSSHQGGTDGDGEMLDEIDYPNIVYTSSDNGGKKSVSDF